MKLLQSFKTTIVSAPEIDGLDGKRKKLPPDIREMKEKTRIDGERQRARADRVGKLTMSTGGQLEQKGE